MRTFAEDMQVALDYHGHICSGIVLGIRMSRLALERLKIDNPLEYRDLIVYVEVDRCLSDAIYAVTGCTLGKRRMKWVDHGKMAATFYDLATKQGVRVAVRASDFPPPGKDAVSFWNNLSDEEVFTVQRVSLDIPPEDLPGPPLRKAKCGNCGEHIMDGREKEVDGRVLCRACAGAAYYKI
ncbi:MAG: FmdE family protein [Desulfotomaculaceae bacterium]|nr:FmdE family protein [Desulfotomaculaceae bacterium]